ncbi:MAG TPA: EscU/YscU/HrcU family type III secretion system export apparatus switch protein [Desulfobacterales bacterium]|nr:EscU/YscU/HrcU family type III secretion system export apparatus switch protein [Desulfobacterales bacterium]HIP38890.1 EscU/YscU/HrcU family type III secretion system export apparatus switch protein [Desulfocapsa sulfexigens]
MKKNELEKAVAILYDSQTTSSPKVVAKGQGEIARKIIETARDAGVHIQEDANLVELLSKIDLGDEIPTELYQTVAEVLSFVYQVNEKFKNKISS